MKQVYLLQHSYEYGEELEHQCTKDLGIYSTYENAEKAKQRYANLEGFCKYPENCFCITEFDIDVDSSWTEEFVGTDEIYRDVEKLTVYFNHRLGIEKNIEESWKDSDYYNFIYDVYTDFKLMAEELQGVIS